VTDKISAVVLRGTRAGVRRFGPPSCCDAPLFTLGHLFIRGIGIYGVNIRSAGAGTSPTSLWIGIGHAGR